MGEHLLLRPRGVKCYRISPSSAATYALARTLGIKNASNISIFTLYISILQHPLVFNILEETERFQDSTKQRPKNRVFVVDRRRSFDTFGRN